ncbi:MAG: hypothetical protein PVH82_02940 [Desulfobacteraceae bacterium]|jgi:hypothetical protein
MDSELFIIKSLFIQNAIMLISLGVVFSLLIHALIKKRRKHSAVFTIWLVLVLWFFNSAIFGFSAVSVSQEGIRLSYGVLSLRNDLLPLDSEWKVETYLSGIRKSKRLYYITIGGRQSMKVKGEDKRQLLQKIGESIDHMKARRPTFQRFSVLEPKKLIG